MEPEIPISPSRTENLYERLGLDIDASAEDIKTAYRRSAIYWHPDKNKSPNSHLEFIAVGEAYEVLSEPYSKMRYDSTLDRTSKNKSKRPDLSDIFSNIHGNKDSDDLGERLKYYMDKFKDIDLGSFSYAASDAMLMDMIGMLSIFGLYKKQKKPEEKEQKYLSPEDE